MYHHSGWYLRRSCPGAGRLSARLAAGRLECRVPSASRPGGPDVHEATIHLGAEDTQRRAADLDVVYGRTLIVDPFGRLGRDVVRERQVDDEAEEVARDRLDGFTEVGIRLQVQVLIRSWASAVIVTARKLPFSPNRPEQSVLVWPGSAASAGTHSKPSAPTWLTRIEAVTHRIAAPRSGGRQ